MTDNLTERLREVRHVVSLPPDDGPTTADLCHQAAERITELEAGLLRALHVINGEFSHGPDDDLTIDEWVTDE